MNRRALVSIGIGVGAVAEIAILIGIYSGANLFHGGHPNPVAHVLLPGIGIVDHLSNHAATAIPLSLFVLSLVQFPVYGAVAALAWHTRRMSRMSIAILALHIAATSVACYGWWLDSRWQSRMVRYAACVREDRTGDTLTQSSAQVVSLVRAVEQTERELDRLRTAKAGGATFRPDPEASLARNLVGSQQELERQWEIYKRSGGTANAPREVVVVPGPCGNPPPRPYLL